MIKNTALFLLIMAVLPMQPAIAQLKDPTIRVVMQVNSFNLEVVERGLRDALEVSEVAQTQKQPLDIRIVVHGRAVDLFETSATTQLRDYFQKLSARTDVHFYVDSQTMGRIHNEIKDLLPGFTAVPSGPYEIVKLEKEGYQYLKP